MAKRHRLEMSAELRSMLKSSELLRKKSKSPTPTIRWIVGDFDDDGEKRNVERTNETYRQIRLIRKANRLLAASGYFQKRIESDEAILSDPSAITAHGGLRPTWQGRV